MTTQVRRIKKAARFSQQRAAWMIERMAPGGSVATAIKPADGITDLETMRLSYLRSLGIDPDFTAEDYCRVVDAFLANKISWEDKRTLLTQRRHASVVAVLG